MWMRNSANLPPSSKTPMSCLPCLVHQSWHHPQQRRVNYVCSQPLALWLWPQASSRQVVELPVALPGALAYKVQRIPIPVRDIKLPIKYRAETPLPSSKRCGWSIAPRVVSQVSDMNSSAFPDSMSWKICKDSSPSAAAKSEKLVEKIVCCARSRKRSQHVTMK